MAKRTLEELQKRYQSTPSAAKRGMFGPGPRGGGPGGRMPGGGKPKNTKQTILRIWRYTAPYKLRLIAVLLCMVSATVSSLIGSYFLMPIINRLAGFPTEGAPLAKLADSVIDAFAKTLSPSASALFGNSVFTDIYVYVMAALMILFCVYVINVTCTYLQSYLMITISRGTIEKIRNDLFVKLEKLPIRYFDSRSKGDIMSSFTNDVDNVGMMLDNSLVSLISGTISLIGTFIFMVTTNWVLTLVTVLFIPVFMFGGAAIAKRSGKFFKGQQSALGAMNGYIEETITGQKVVKVFGHEQECVEEFELLNEDLRQKQMKAQFFGGIMGPVMGNTSQISYSLTIGVGGILLALSGQLPVSMRLSPGGLTVFANYSRQFSMPINMISQQMTTVFSALAGAERVFAIMDAEPEADDLPDADPMTDMKGHVILDNVTFGYLPEQTVLKNISLYAKPGQKIAFVGSTGAGKTTITNLLNRFYPVREGQITIDGVPIEKIERDALRKKIAMVFQDTHLFTGTVMENIRYGRMDATDEEVIEAAKTASAHSFIMRLSDGYSTMLEGDGANLSQGQRQLLNIARAAISHAPILVLDEATSSVDTRTERHIEHGMDRLMRDRTTFVIAHRLSTVRNADAIMVLERGEIIERGNHDQLLAMKGRYYELYTGRVELD